MPTASQTIKKILEKATDTTELPDARRRLIAVACMATTVFLSCFDYTYTTATPGIFWGETIRTIKVQITPSLMSTLLSIFLLSSIFIRNKIKISYYNITLYILNILFTASLLSVFVSGDLWNIPFFNISSQSIIYLAAIFSWFGMRSMAGLIWLFIFFLSIFRMSEINIAFGSFGVIYILAGVIGIACQIRDVNVNFLRALRNDFFGYSDSISEDISHAQKTMKDASQTIQKAITGP